MSNREANKQQKKQTILAAAEAMIRENGAGGLSMRDLAKDAGVAHVTPYNLFESKHGILLALLQNTQNPLVTVFDVDPESDRLLLEHFNYNIDCAVTFIQSDSPYLKNLLIAFREAGLNEDAAHLYRKAIALRLTKIIEAAVKRGELKEETPVITLSVLILSTFTGAYWSWLDGNIKLDHLQISLKSSLSISLMGYAIDPLKSELKKINDEQETLHRFFYENGGLANAVKENTPNENVALNSKPAENTQLESSAIKNTETESS